jgi:CRP-like cAMP-binding protein
MFIEQRKFPEQFFNNAFFADDLFDGLSPASQSSLRAVKSEKRLAGDKTIFESGEHPRDIYILTEGAAQILSHAGRPVRSIEPNEILGLTEAISNLPSEVSAKTVSECRFECIRRDRLLAFLQTEPAVCFRLLQRLGANLHKLYQLLH